MNETFVKRYFSGHNPIGRHIGIGEDPGTAMPIEIVGVAKDTHYMGVREDLRPQVFVPALESGIERLTFYVRSAGEPGQIMAALRRTVASLDPSLPIYNVSSMEQRVARSTANERLIASLSGVLSGMATLLAVIGLYGVMAYTVTRRTREIGIRMALGAMGSQVAGRILREAGMLVGVGLLLGWAAGRKLGPFRRKPVVRREAGRRSHHRHGGTAPIGHRGGCCALTGVSGSVHIADVGAAGRVGPISIEPGRIQLAAVL